MNINDVKELKATYEEQLKTRISGLIGLPVEAISADWSLEKTILRIDVNQQNTITTFAFEYDGEDFVLHTSSYQMVAQNDALIGIIASVATISLNTIHAIFDTVVDVLNTSINEDKSEEDISEEEPTC